MLWVLSWMAGCKALPEEDDGAEPHDEGTELALLPSLSDAHLGVRKAHG